MFIPSLLFLNIFMIIEVDEDRLQYTMMSGDNT